jgi:hypothetical protein
LLLLQAQAELVANGGQPAFELTAFYHLLVGRTLVPPVGGPALLAIDLAEITICRVLLELAPGTLPTAAFEAAFYLAISALPAVF